MRGRAYDLVRERRSDWPQVFAGAATVETEPSLLAALFEALEAHDRAIVERLVDRALVQPADAPALFTWIAERAAGDEALRASAPLRLFKRILLALVRDELQPYRRRLVALSESGGTLPRLLPHFAEADAVDALESLRKSTGLSTDRKRSLEDAVMLRFPALRVTEEPLYALEDSIRAKREELKTLLEQEIPRNRRAIEEARALGDLRENFEYKSARQRHEYLSARAEALSGELSRSKADRPRPSRSVAGRHRHRGAAARRGGRRAAAHPARAVGERARVRRAVVPVGGRAVAARPATGRRGRPRRQELSRGGDLAGAGLSAGAGGAARGEAPARRRQIDHLHRAVELEDDRTAPQQTRDPGSARQRLLRREVGDEVDLGSRPGGRPSCHHAPSRKTNARPPATARSDAASAAPPTRPPVAAFGFASPRRGVGDEQRDDRHRRRGHRAELDHVLQQSEPAAPQQASAARGMRSPAHRGLGLDAAREARRRFDRRHPLQLGDHQPQAVESTSCRRCTARREPPPAAARGRGARRRDRPRGA